MKEVNISNNVIGFTLMETKLPFILNISQCCCAKRLYEDILPTLTFLRSFDMKMDERLLALL